MSRISVSIDDGKPYYDIAHMAIEQISGYLQWHGIPVKDIAVGPNFGLILRGQMSVTEWQMRQLTELGFKADRGGKNGLGDFIIELTDNENVKKIFEDILSKVDKPE